MSDADKIAPPKPKRYPYAVTPKDWFVYQRTPVACAVKPHLGGGIQFDFNVSATPDPNSPGPWIDYLMMNQPTTGFPAVGTAPIKGKFLTYEIQCVASPGTKFNYMSDANNVAGTSPASVRAMIKRGTWNDMIEGSPIYGLDRFWCNSVSHVLGNDPSVVTLDCPLDPENWISAFGHKATESTDFLAAFNATVSAPTLICLTFGGGFFYGHGVNVTGGTAQFRLVKCYTHD